MARRAATIVAALALLWAAGAAASAGSLGEREYRARADAICSGIERDVVALVAPHAPQEVRPYLDRLIPILRRAGRRLAGLAPPAGLAADHARFLLSGRRSLTVFRAMRARIVRGDDPAVVVRQASPRLGRLDAQGTAAADALGLPACAQQVGPGT